MDRHARDNMLFISSSPPLTEDVHRLNGEINGVLDTLIKYVTLCFENSVNLLGCFSNKRL